MYASAEFALPFALALALFFLLERVTGAVIGLFWGSGSELKSATASRFLISCFEFLCNCVFASGYSVLSLASGLLSVMLWASVLMLLGSIMYVTYEQSPWVWTDLIRAYNAFFGPFIQGTVIALLDLFNMVFHGLVPLYNGSIFFVGRVLQGWLFPTMVQEIATFKAMGQALFNLALHSVMSLVGWVQTVVVDCPPSNGDACFDLSGRTLDLVTPLADARDSVIAASAFVGKVCPLASALVDIVTYPLMDLNFATGVHRLFNAVLFMFVQVPDVTFLRCQRHGAEEALMCTPDLDPIFAMLVSGVSDLGLMADNWLDATYVIVQGVLGWTSHACDAVSLAPPFLGPGSLRSSLFGGNQTAIVGLTGWLMAVTDGAAIAYYGRGSMRAAVWPAPVNVSFGVAAVTYAGSSTLDVTSLSSSAYSGSTALFGCACVLDGRQIQIQCSVVPYEGLLANQSSSVPVLFQDGAAQSALSCPDIDVVMQSVRWPATRFTSANPLPDCSLKATCNQVDATVWVVPRAGCDAESTRCDCFPFCMGVRLAGGQAGPIVLYGASQWRSAVYAVRRDCNLQSASSQLLDGLSVSPGPGGPVSTVQTPSAGGLQYVVGSQISCTDNLLVTSLIDRAQHPAYTAPTPAFLRNPAAPFVITGDTMLTAVRHGDGGYTVRVERLTGSTGSEYTLSEVTSVLPAYPPADVPHALFAQFPRDHLTIPYARQATLAVSSRQYVFYAVNPAMQVYGAYLTYCRDSVQLPQFGLIMTSSFSPIRVWRVDAYRRCNAAGCGSDLVSQVDIPDAFSNGTDDGSGLTWDCLRSYNEGITQLEYINSANIAVTVRRTDVNGSFVEYRTYWLNADTMQLTDAGPWADSVQTTTAALGAYTLCPAMQILPEAGSLAAGVVNAGIHLTKMVVGVVVYFPGIVRLWSSGTVCPLQTRGHSVLQQCGSQAFLLDDFFGSLQASTNIFWGSLALLSQRVGTLGSSDASAFAQNVLNGASRYGAGSIDLWTAGFQVLSVMRAPGAALEEAPEVMLAQAEGGAGWAQGGFKLAANSLGWARFCYTSLVKIVVTIAQNVLLNQPVGAGRAWRIVVNTLDEMRGDFEGDVVDNLRQSCAGISLMMGLTNPWAVLVYQQCIAANTAVAAGVDLTLSVFNLAPFAQCMCSGSAGRVFGDYARLYCVPQASTRLRPVLLQMIQASQAPPIGQGLTASQALCQNMLDYTKASMVGSVQPWFDAQFASMNALGSSLDYAMSWFDPTAGQCLDYNEDPDVVVIMPYPVDYFQACGGTSLCRAKCAGVWDAFDQALAGSQASSYTQTVSVSVESLFFPSMTADSFNPMRIWAVLEPTGGVCVRVCGGQTGGQTSSCVAVAGVKGGSVVVQYYCTPTLMTASVFRTLDASLEWAFPGSGGWSGDLIQLQFADADGRVLAALCSDGSVRMGSLAATETLATLSTHTLDLGRPVLAVTALRVFSRPPLASVHVSLLFRLANGQVTASPLHRKLVVDTSIFPAPGSPGWINLGTDGSLFSSLDSYAASQVSPTAFAPTATFLLLPLLDGLPVSLQTVEWDTDTSNGVVSWTQTSLTGVPEGLGALLSSGEVLSQNCYVDSEGGYIAFAGAPPFQSTAWLSQVRVTGATAAAYSSQAVAVSVQSTTQCAVQSCAGCPDGEVQSLCDAVQACAVINCIGTPVNMRRVLCQLGQTLADETREGLAVMFGGWVVFVDMFMSLMDLSLQRGLTGVTLTFPDDSFFGYVCTAKDRYAHMVSVFTSALNSVTQVGYSAVVYLEGGAHNIDNNFNAMVTMPLTALTSFIYQLFLAPLYGLMAAQKIMMCRIEGVMAVFDVSGFAVTVGEASMQSASDSAVGQCLTANFATQLANPADSSNAQSTGRIVTAVAQSSALAMIPSLTFRAGSLETIMHMIDAAISYVMGIVSALADVLQSLDLAHCKLPDYFLNETVFCACGDYPYGIAPARKQEGLAGAGLWCTGTLSLLDASNQPYVVYNPYTYAELQALAAGTDAYLACMSDKAYVSGETDCHAPAAGPLQSQGVSVLTVLTACKNNYLQSQWDRGAHILFNRTLFGQVVSGAAYPSLAGLPPPVVSAGQCLTDPASRTLCLESYLTLLGVSSEVYWGYESISDGPSQFVDACQVFTGPASNPLLTSGQLSTFRACLDQYADSNCQLSSSLWTPQSDNAVPVAWRHAVSERSGSAIQEVVALKYQEARDLVLAALSPLAGYSNPQLQTVFFSPEGDIMHQMMDCVFLGPYTNVNYWPLDSARHLPVPAWFRDANGSSRALDPRACVQGSSDRSPPYSCGSQARQAVIKYFFRDFLPRNENATMGDIINSMAGDLFKAWSNLSAYPCLCADNVTRGNQCCDLNGTRWLPPALDVPYQSVPVSTVLRSLTTQLQAFYRHAMEDTSIWTKHLNADALAGYDWGMDARYAAIATKEGLYRTDQPVVRYDASEIRSPMLTTALWHQCHGLLSQIFFTIPMQSSGQWVPRGSPPMDGVDGLDAFVASAVSQAFQDSPLFRHYNVSHVPSDSRMCRDFRVLKRSQRKATVSSYSAQGVVMLDTSIWPGLPAYGTEAFPISGCFCGWDGDGTVCSPPGQVCSALRDLCPAFTQSPETIARIKGAWQATWPCPALSLSDHSGVLDASEMDDWLLGTQRDYSISGQDLLRRGRGGLRVGNVGNMSGTLSSPAQRTLEPSEAALPYCASAYILPPDLLDPVAQLKAFVARLFPVAQGVYESGTTAYCLRYSVESALLSALGLAMPLADVGAAYASQRLVSDLWRTRCEGQIALLALCKGLDVYQPPVNPAYRQFACPFSVSTSSASDVYVTPGCLVHSAGVFYDPCNCPGFVCGPTLPYFNTFPPSCQIPFDPRGVVGDNIPLGGWLVSPLEAFNTTAFAQSILSASDALGNTPRGGDWAGNEGFLNVTGRHCDMMADWWPADETLPVGYHATVPCSSDETGYRTFDSAFAVERIPASGQFTVARLVYQHDLTRDAASVDSQVGGGGVCRASNLGLPFVSTNNMVLCTQQQTAQDTLDPAIPAPQANYPFGQERCAPGSASVPWFDPTNTLQDSSLHSLGTVPNMPSGGTYPATNQNSFGIGPASQILQDLQAGNNGWGDGCSDFALRECASSAECPPSFFCLLSARVCMHTDFQTVTGTKCFRNDMCPAGLLCDGTGSCVQGFIYYHNNVSGTMEAAVFAESCDEASSNSYYTDGASPWEYVPDWLQGHGMCANKNWYYYSLSLQGAQACGTCSGTACSLNARRCSLPFNASLWWPPLSATPLRLAVQPTLCDRDYEHLSGPTGRRMVGCSPSSTVLDNQVTDLFGAKQPLAYAGLFRNYGSDGTTSLAKMPLSTSNRTGFLGLTPAGLSNTAIVNCEQFQNCYAYPFTFNGAQVTRTYWPQGSYASVPYINDDIFRCGVTAYYDSARSKCMLDVKALPLYAALCQSPVLDTCTCRPGATDAIGCVSVVDRLKVQGICSNILLSYPASYDIIVSNTKNLQALFNVFLQSDRSLAAHVSGLECFNALYGYLQSPQRYTGQAVSVHYPFNFALFEVPLVWLYQCSFLAGIAIDPSAATIPCQKFASSKSLRDVLQLPDTQDSGQAFDFDLVHAGYRRSDLLASIGALGSIVNSSLPPVASVAEFLQYCSSIGVSDCEMVPYCANSLKWKPNALLGDLTRRLLAALYATRCGQDVKTVVLASLNRTFPQAIADFTVLTDFRPDLDPSLPSITSLLNASLQGCIGQAYDPGRKWPFSLSFPMDQASLDACMKRRIGVVLNDLSMALVADSYMYSDVDVAYMPSTNIEGQQYMTSSFGTQACIFPDVNSERQNYDLSPLPTNCLFQNQLCPPNPPCRTYPLVYMTGKQACRYPTSAPYSSLRTLIAQVWTGLRDGFLKNVYIPASVATPVAFDLFTSSDQYFAGWAYDVTGIRSYMSNINPDTTKEVMCVLSSVVINFTTCNDPNYAALQAFTDSQRQQAAPLVPEGTQLAWKVSSAFLAQGAVFAFANTTRSSEQVLLRTLFDNTARCGIGEKMENRVCLVSTQGGAGTSARPWVPWMSGQWNPYEGCDVRMMELTQGYQEEIWPYDPSVCPDCSGVTGAFRTGYLYDSTPSCDSKQHTYSKLVDVESTAPTNLCYVTMQNTDSVCMNAQGMVGGGRGQSVLNHPTVPHLYGTTNVTGWPVPGGIYPRGSPVFGGADEAGDFGILSIPGDELGAAAIGLSVEPVQGSVPYLRVARVPLQPQAGFMTSWDSNDVSEWVQALQPSFEAEDALHAAEQASRGSGAWDCPVRRMAFYGASMSDSDFAPAVPSPGRARRLFGQLTGNLSAHPTQALRRDGSALGEYLTSNGFCYCPSGTQSPQTQCLIPVTDRSHNCSLYKTIQALQGQWVQSYVFPPQSAGGLPTPCQMQLDWPYLDGVLRDGTGITGDFSDASDPVGRRCHLLDRLRPFQYRYKSAGPPVAVPGTSTLSQGGACHSGRAAKLTPNATAKLVTTRCVKQSETASAISVSCEDGSSFLLDKEQSAPLDSMVQAAKAARTKCSQCSPPPAFVNSKRNPIPPESSFGIPFRFSASRAVAADLQGAVCASLPNCSDVLNPAAWTAESFMRTLLLSPADLFLGATPPPPPAPASQAQWPDGEWVFCNSTEALRQGACQGVIREADWRGDRFRACYNKINDLTLDTPDVMSTVDVCLMDSNLNELCTAVSQAQTLVREANCIASGSPACALKPFLYQPAAWDVSNREFVHGTVTAFYRRVAQDSCPSVSAAIQANNEAVLNRCAATPVTAVYLALQACRDIVDALALVLFYASSILIDGLLLAFSSNRAALEAQIVYYWNCIIRVVEGLLSVLSNILFDMLFHMGSMGQRIYAFLLRTCGMINTAYGYWLEVWCGIALDLAPGALGGLRHVAEMCETAFGVINAALDSIFTAIVPSALSRMESLGFTQGFRDKQAQQQARSKQNIDDSLKASKKESKSADDLKSNAKKRSTKQALRSAATGDLAQGLLLSAATTGVSMALEASPAMSLVFGLGNSISDAIETSKLMSLYPQNWTLFDFSDIYLALDTLEYFITSDDMCLRYRQANMTQILNCTFPPLASADSLAGAMMVATRCWADAQRDVGTSNLLACTESDTCYKSLYDRSSPVVCGTCPDVGSGFSVFGCSSITKMCTCSVPTLQASRCTSNFECSYSGSTCQLITGLDDMSYGNQPCIGCSKDVQCLVRDSSGIGTCGCMFQTQPIQQCSQTPGQSVPVTSPNKMCGLLVGADKSQPLVAVQMDSLALAPCIYLNPALVFCVQVYQGGTAALMAVGLGMAPLGPSFQSRRLLVDGRMLPEVPFELHQAQSEYSLPDTEEGHRLLSEDWNGTAEPCSSLAHIYQQAARTGALPALGPTDTLRLHACAYWRLVGRRTIERYNLTSLTGKDGFLLSSDDLASALSQRWVLVELLRNPEAILFALAHSPLLKPFYAALLSVRSLTLSLGSNLRVRRSANASAGNASGGADEEIADLLEALDEGWDDAPESEACPDGDSCGAGDEERNATGRRLLQASSTDISFAETWLEGPFTWPPPFLTQLAAARCDVASAIFQIFHDVMLVLSRYYSGSFSKPPEPSRRVWDNLPSLESAQALPASPAPQSWTGWVYHGVWGVIGLQPGFVREFFSNNADTNVFTVGTSLLKCDFEALTFCSAHRKDLLSSFILFGILYLIVSYVCGLFGVPFLGTVMIMLGTVPIVLWYAYGMAITCAPMVPTCILDDVIYTLNTLFPAQITLPGELQVSPDCLGDPSRTACLKPCSQPPMSFVDWRDTFAYGACYFSSPLCRSLAGLIGNWDPVSTSLLERAVQVEQGTSSLLSACSFCFAVTFVNLIPVLVLVLIAITAASSLLYLPCVLLPKFLPLLAESVHLGHTE